MNEAGARRVILWDHEAIPHLTVWVASHNKPQHLYRRADGNGLVSAPGQRLGTGDLHSDLVTVTGELPGGTKNPPLFQRAECQSSS